MPGLATSWANKGELGPICILMGTYSDPAWGREVQACAKGLWLVGMWDLPGSTGRVFVAKTEALRRSQTSHVM
jgi:hypothetical protein